MPHPVLHRLTQQLTQGEAAAADWVTCTYMDQVTYDMIRLWHKNGYVAAADTQAAVDAWWNLCAARGYQVMPGCQGVPHDDVTGTHWVVQYHVDMRGRRRAAVVH